VPVPPFDGDACNFRRLSVDPAKCSGFYAHLTALICGGDAHNPITISFSVITP